MKQLLLQWLCLAYCGCLFAWEPSSDFVAYIKSCEGFRSTPYVCPAGKLTIGYGHAIKAGEIYAFISYDDATELLIKDIRAAYKSVCRQTGTYPTGITAEMLVDFQFNLGSLRKFPKFVQACLDNDTEIIKREYKRYYNGREMAGRNKKFKEYFKIL